MTSRSDSVVSFVKRVLSVVFAFICWIAGLGTVLLGILYFIISELPTAVPLVIAGIIILPPITRRFFNTKKRRGFVTWAFFLLWIASMVIYSSGVARSVLNNDRNHAGETAQHEEPVPQSGQEVSQDVEADSVDEQDVLPDIQDVLPDSESVPLAAETETVPDFSGRWYDTNLNVMLAAQDGVSLSFQIYQSDKDAPYASFSGILKNGVVSYEDGKNLRNVPADISIAESGVVNMSEDEIQWTYVSRGEYRRASFYRLEALPSTAAKKPQYLFPSDSQYITRQDLDRLNREQVSLVRNEIYARYGYTFETESVAKYFLEQSWYTPDANVNAGSLDIENMNAYERANIETILQYEIEKGWRSASGSQTGSSRSEAQPPVEDPYLFPTDKKYITKQDLKGLTQKQVSLIRNEIYARYGYNFVDPEIRDYFKGKSWYRARPGVNANTFGEEDMTPVERTNLETIISYERDMKWRS